MSDKRADKLARKHTEAAIQTLAEIMYDGDAKPADRIKAADSILDRGHGKAQQAIIVVPMDKQSRDALYDLSDEELMAEAKRRMAQRVRTEPDYEQPVIAHEEFAPIDNIADDPLLQ